MVIDDLGGRYRNKRSVYNYLHNSGIAVEKGEKYDRAEHINYNGRTS